MQCGPDSLAPYPPLTPCTSIVKMPQVFSTGIKINDVGANCNVQGTDFSTSTQETTNFKTMTPRLRRVGIKIKDSDLNLCSQTDCSTMTIPKSVPQSRTLATDHTVASVVSFNGTKLIKPIVSALKIDSGSDFCAPSIASTTKTCADCITSTSENKLKSPMSKLSCGAVHVHSYKDKQVSEDVCYQGAWQEYKPEGNTRKMTLNVSTLRKSNEARKPKEHLKEKKVNSKERLYRKRQDKKQVVAAPMKPTQIRNTKLNKVSQEEKSGEVKKPRASKSSTKISNITKGISRPIKTTKVMKTTILGYETMTFLLKFV